jgi:uncharacterized protein (DUF983 family)
MGRPFRGRRPLAEPTGGAALLVTALRCRCPRCGRGQAFTGFLDTVPQCGVCGLSIGDMDNGDGPAVFIIFILGAAVVPLAIWGSGAIEAPLRIQAAFWSVVILGLTIGMLRPAKALVLALNYRYRAGE